MATTLWGGQPSTFGPDATAFGEGGDPAPAAPAPLLGEFAQSLLDYLPSYYHESTYVRAILQAAGYEIDMLVAYMRDVFPTLGRPADCPRWALASYEALLALPGRRLWDEDARRASIAGYFSYAVTASEVTEFLARETRIDPADITLSATGHDLTITIANTTTAEDDAAIAAAYKVVPAHMTWNVNGRGGW